MYFRVDIGSDYRSFGSLLLNSYNNCFVVDVIKQLNWVIFQ